MNKEELKYYRDYSGISILFKKSVLEKTMKRGLKYQIGRNELIGEMVITAFEEQFNFIFEETIKRIAKEGEYKIGDNKNIVKV